MTENEVEGQELKDNPTIKFFPAAAGAGEYENDGLEHHYPDGNLDRIDHLFLKFLHKHSKAYAAARTNEQYSESKDEDYEVKEHDDELPHSTQEPENPEEDGKEPEGEEEHVKDEL
jgi:hypothetical protein